jgi:hypothetical protein
MSENTEKNQHGAEPTEPLLDSIDGPADLHELDDSQLQQVAGEMRTYIIDTIGQIGGHFGANLGTCTACWRARATRSSGTSATSPTRTRC